SSLALLRNKLLGSNPAMKKSAGFVAAAQNPHAMNKPAPISLNPAINAHEPWPATRATAADTKATPIAPKWFIIVVARESAPLARSRVAFTISSPYCKNSRWAFSETPAQTDLSERSMMSDIVDRLFYI